MKLRLNNNSTPWYVDVTLQHDYRFKSTDFAVDISDAFKEYHPSIGVDLFNDRISLGIFIDAEDILSAQSQVMDLLNANEHTSTMEIIKMSTQLEYIFDEEFNA